MPTRRYLLFLALFLALTPVPASANVWFYFSSGYFLLGDTYEVWAYVEAFEDQYCSPYTDWWGLFDASIDGGCSGHYYVWYGGSGYRASSDTFYCSGAPPGSWYNVSASVCFFMFDCYWWECRGDYTLYTHIDSTPSFLSLDPIEGEPGQTGTMVANGDLLNLTPVTLLLTGGNCGLQWTGDTTSGSRYVLSRPYEVAAGAQDGGQCELRVSNAYGVSGDSHIFTARLYAPTISSLDPSGGQRGQQGTLWITGDHFYPNETAVSSNCGITFGAVTRESNTTIWVPYSISWNAPLGWCTVQVGNSKGSSPQTNNFCINCW
jgi:hypothetical protein